MHDIARRQIAAISPIESYPDYSLVKWENDLALEVRGYDLEAARWVSGLLVQIMCNPTLQKT